MHAPRLLRSAAAVLVLTFALVAGLSVTTQRQSHAIAPAAAVVAPTVARTIIAPVAKWACGTACRGALVAGAAAIPEALCSFVFDTCTMPWTQNPDLPPNGDQPSGGALLGPTTYPCNPGSGWVCGGSITVSPSGVVSVAATVNVDLTGVGMTLSVACNGGGFASGSGTWSGSPTSTLSITATAPLPAAPLCREGGTADVRSGSGTTYLYATWTGAPPSGATSSNPERTGQAYKRCENTSGASVIVWGALTTYTETDQSRTAQLPSCPATHPIPNGGGVVKGNPWAPGHVTGTLGTATPLTPDVKMTPDLLPKRPIYPAMQSPRYVNPTAPGVAPGEALPTVDPATGQPVLNPDGTPKTQPKPGAAPDGRYCMWGGYLVPAADCEGTDGDPDAPHDPDSGAAPYPRPVPREDEDGCLSSSVSLNPVTWVLAPVKCALQWAFVPKPEAITEQVEDLTVVWNASAPGAYLGATGALLGDLGDLGQNASGCSGPSVTFNTGLLRGTYKPLDACPGSMAAQAASVVRVIFLVGLYLGAAALGARILAASFGLNLPGFGRGTDGEA